MTAKEKSGRVVAVCSSPNHGYPTYPQEYANVTPEGIEGDAHSGALRESFTKPGTLKPNDRPISIVAQEVINEMNSKFGLNIQPGGFNEQVVVSGLGDLSNITIGSVVTFNGGVMLEVVDNAYPCQKLNAFHGEPLLEKELVKKLPDGSTVSKRGILASVRKPGLLTPGEAVTIQKHLSN